MMKKFVVLGLTLFCLLAESVATAQASPPVHDRFGFEVDFVDAGLSALCGFDVRVVADVEIRETVYFDKEGNPTRVSVHVSYAGSLTNLATGLTLRDPGAFNLSFDLVDGTIREAGMHFAIVVPGEGVVVLDAGRLVVVDGDLVFEAGPHQQLHGGDSLICEALD